MYFKQLELVGFKSFPDKTKLKFEPGVTAVVGPNGCGKSNIADAIRWVLGEQSPKSLRGSSMEDVIFNGTDATEPINMAEVSLTLSNEDRTLPIDYDEVTITRRLFRSGESEYLLNKTAVRLKDVHALLMGTGMGTSSYFIIEQGKIDRILSSSPEDRRYVFEEASGITKYKSQKKEALRKLEHTENNLVRINDIINEVKRQINSIERHAKKAERYKTDFEAMKELDVRLAANELKAIKGGLDNHKGNLGEIRQEEGGLRAELEGKLNLITKYREDLDGAIRRLTEAQQELSDATLFIDKSKHKTELNAERITDLRNLKSSAEEDLERLGEKVNRRKVEIGTLKERYENTVKGKSEKEKTLVAKERSAEEFSREIDSHHRDIKKAKTEVVNLLAFQTKTKNELIKMGADLQNRKSRQRRLETEREKIGEEKNSAESALAGINSELASSRGKVQKCEDVLRKLKERLDSSEGLLKTARQRIIEGQNELNSLGSKEEILKEMIASFEGFEKGVKALMEAAGSGALAGVIGVVADMIEPEKGYESALEAALGKKAQAIIVENAEAMKRAHSYVAGKGCSAGFIIYEDITKAVEDRRKKRIMEKNGMPALSSLVTVKDPHNRLADYLLGGIYVAETKDIAYAMLKRKKVNAVFVTRDGFLVENGYVFSGFGRQENTASIIGRAKRLVDIQGEKERLAKGIEAAGLQEKECEKETEDLKKAIASASGELKEQEIAQANIESRKKQADGNLKRINDEDSVVNLEISEVNELIREISDKGGGLNNRLNVNESESAKVQEFISSSQQAIQVRTGSRNNLMFEISDIKSEITFLNHTREQEARNLARESLSLEEIKTQYGDREKQAKEADDKIAALLEESKDLEEGVREKEREKARFEEALKEIAQNRADISRRLRDEETVSREKEKLAENLRDRIRNLEVKETEGELKAVNIRDRLREAYRIDIEVMDVETGEGANWEEIRNQVEVLKIKLEKLGPVNLVAIDELKELEERHSFLTQQQEDLLRAKESLHKAIIKISRTTKVLFMEAFTKIQVEFKNYFRMLFGGGHAELLLIDESDVLESGIEIVARPPGKKLQNLLLLSGGEKALTTIALLFAIFKVKPSPFCILDEVDAPLDESNIGKFIRVLQDFLKMSQFIVITHSKRTMQMANILYGITMQQKGISKIVSVKLTDTQKEGLSEKKEVLV